MTFPQPPSNRRESTRFGQKRPDEFPPATLSDNARIVLARRYLKKNEDGEPIESPEQMFGRVSRTIAEADLAYGSSATEVEETARGFYALMADGRFEPNSPTLMNAGRPLGQLSACFVLPVEDALSNGENGIYDTLTAMALVHQSGGGTGFSFSRLRPEGDTVRSSLGVASGPVSFIRLYDASTDVVKQGGTRRGANMAILRVDHPDIRQFIGCKNDTSMLTNFNISVAITDAFMEAVVSGDAYDLIHPKTGGVVGQEDARQIFDRIVHGAWLTGEPGTFFVDRANEHNPVPALGSYEATNPCGEQPLLPYDVCNLGSIDLGKFVKTELPASGDPAKRIDWEGLGQVVHQAVHFLDNVIDQNRYPLPQIEQLAQNIRRIGLGVMGWADMLIRLRVPYDSEQGVGLARQVMGFVNREARSASEALAQKRGVFSAWEESIWGPDGQAAKRADGKRIRPQRRLRNCNLTTVAPTGSISILAGCSGGIEPLFAVAFMRNQAGAFMPDANADFVREAQAGSWYSEELMERIAQEGHIHFDEVPQEVQRIFRTAHDISPEWHVRMQAAFQEHTDSAISKTTNFPNAATEEDVRKIYELAFRLGCKGVTVYRDGCREGQVLSTGATSKPGSETVSAVRLKELEAQLADACEESDNLRLEIERLKSELQGQAPTKIPAQEKRDRPTALRGYTMKMKSPLGDLYVTVNEDVVGNPFEVFCTLGKAGGAANADAEAVGRLMSLAVRSGIPIRQVIDQLRGISCDRVVGLGPNKVLSVPDAIAQAIERYLEETEGVQQALPFPSATGGSSTATESDVDAGWEPFDMGTCPDCDTGHLAFEEGCKKCHVCGFSQCG